MAMNYRVVKLALVTAVIAFTSLTLAGCGQNTMGPTAPAALVPQAAAPAAVAEAPPLATGAETEVSAACHPGGGGGSGGTFKKGRQNRWRAHHFSHYRGLLNYLFVRFFSKYIALKWYQDHDMHKTVKRIVHSPAFFIIYVRCGVGNLIITKVLHILSNTWFPGLGTNPAETTPEVTLLPYRWKMGCGFYGDRLEGWTNGNGYQLTCRTPALDYVFLDTKSLPNNIYQNTAPIYQFSWDYGFAPYVQENGIPQLIGFRLENQDWNKRMVFPDSNRIIEDEKRIEAREVWASTDPADKSGRLWIQSIANDALNMDFTFIADGSGGGTLDIQRKNGCIDHYEFTIHANGHGYYTKNNGKKRCF